MKTTDTNRVNMIRTTKSYCENNPTPTAGIPAFAIALTGVKNKLLLIDSLDQIATGTTTGVTLDTNNLRKAMSEIAIKCGSAVTAYANSINDNTLKAKVDYTLNALNKFKKEEVDDICQTIHDEANANIAAAGAFGYTAADVTDLQTSIDLYRTSVQNPRQAIISKGSAISQIENLIRDVIDNSLKGLMDKMVTTVKTASPVFYNEYFLGREIIDLGSTTGKIRGTVSDNAGNLLDGVVFSVFKTGTPILVAKTTSSGGGKFGIANLNPADLDLVWELATFQIVRENNVHISAGKELKRTITMIPV